MSTPVVDDGRPNPSASVAARVRLRYAKRGKLRFCSHRDIARAFERAVRKAGLPIAYSQGFSPHPRLSWIGAAPTGAASEAEYVEMGLIAPMDPAAVTEGLNGALPDGVTVLETVPAGAGGLADRIDGSHWRVTLPAVPAADLRTAVAALLAEDTVPVPRRTKSGTRDVDVRAALVRLTVLDGSEGDDSAPDGDPDRDTPADVPRAQAKRATSTESTPPAPAYGILDAVVRQTTPTVRPDDVLSALRVVADLGCSAAMAVRIAQGRLDDGGHLADPLAPDRAG